LAACPDGTAEEVAQDVFLAAHRALAEDRYRGDGSPGAWLFGIARNLCSKVYRDSYRHAIPAALRHLERDIARLEHDVAHHMHWPAPVTQGQVQYLQEQLTLTREVLMRERERLQQCLREAAHCDPPASPDAPRPGEDARTMMHQSLQQLARGDRQAYTLLHMHVLKGVTVRQLAELQGMSRSTVARSLTRAKATLRSVYQSAMSTHQEGCHDGSGSHPSASAR
jgi:RNA polymerase sigma factor (sigma-70 family)